MVKIHVHKGFLNGGGGVLYYETHGKAEELTLPYPPPPQQGIIS